MINVSKKTYYYYILKICSFKKYKDNKFQQILKVLLPD